MSLIHTRGSARIDSNLTPMIDLSFLLIVFFILVARMGGDQAPPVALPIPHDGAMTPSTATPRIAVNVLAETPSPAVTIGTRRFGTAEADIPAIAATIAQRLRADPKLSIDVRADRTLTYAQVEPALRAIGSAAELVGGTKVTVRVCALGGVSDGNE